MVSFCLNHLQFTIKIVNENNEFKDCLASSFSFVDCRVDLFTENLNINAKKANANVGNKSESDLVRRPIEIIQKIEERLKTSSFNRYNFRPLVMFPCVTYTRLVLNDMHNSSRLVYYHGPFGQPSRHKKNSFQIVAFSPRRLNESRQLDVLAHTWPTKRTVKRMIFSSRIVKILNRKKWKTARLFAFDCQITRLTHRNSFAPIFDHANGRVELELFELQEPSVPSGGSWERGFWL